jgi:hypothetical protein
MFSAIFSLPVPAVAGLKPLKLGWRDKRSTTVLPPLADFLAILPNTIKCFPLISASYIVSAASSTINSASYISKTSSFHFSGLSLFFQRSQLMDKPAQKNVDFLVTHTPGDKLTNSFLSH